jgi:hypothetical protein
MTGNPEVIGWPGGSVMRNALVVIDGPAPGWPQPGNYSLVGGKSHNLIYAKSKLFFFRLLG